MEERYEFIKYIRQAIGSPYRWGSQNIDNGFDCSGLVIWAFKQMGWRLNDMTSSELFDHFHHHRCLQPASNVGCLWFYGDSPAKLTHVMVVLEKWDNGEFILAGARGGNSKTTDNNIAYREKAFVDVVHGSYWNNNF